MLLSSCGGATELKFTEKEYILRSGEGVAVTEKLKGVRFETIDCPYDEVVLNPSSGIFSFDESIPNYTQVMVKASWKNLVSDPCVVTLVYDYLPGEVRFLNRSDYLCDGEYVTAVSERNYSVTYELAEAAEGIEIERDTGKIGFTPKAKNGSEFTIRALSHGESYASRTFYAMTEGFITTEETRQAMERGSDVPAIYALDFSSSEEAEKEGVLDVVTIKNEAIAPTHWTYDEATRRLKILPSYQKEARDGTSELKIITARNAIRITLDIATRYIYTPEDLSSINESEESLKGFYLLMEDIDLSSYLSREGKGYNDGKGWTPIGLYRDVPDMNQATRMAFKGVFDGNGHVVSGLYANRKDEASFNAGLFGYVTSSAEIRNLGVRGELTVSSYSGGLVGSNSGRIENCFSSVNMNVYSGEEIYRYVGGLVGNNFGTIVDCYASGDVLCDTYSGSFVGSNTGVISNCFAKKSAHSPRFSGYGTVDDSCILFESEEEMNAFDWPSAFDETYWMFGENLPELKSPLKEYAVRKIRLKLARMTYDVGDTVSYSVEIFPREYEELYRGEIRMGIEGEGYVLSADGVETSEGISDHFILTASLSVDGVRYEDSVRCSRKKRIKELKLVCESSFDAGGNYELRSSYSPEDAGESVSYRIVSPERGIALNENLLSIDDECSVKSVTLRAENEDGSVFDEVTVPIRPQRTLNPVFLYEDESEDIRFDLGEVDLNGMRLRNDVPFRTEGNYAMISRSVIRSRNEIVRFVFELKDGSLFGGDVCFFDHARYDERNVGNAVKIYTVDDFFRYFNAEKSSYDPEKKKNYDRSYLLMNDLDFAGKELMGIGYSAESEGEILFEGKFYGMNHAMRNFKIAENENGARSNSASRFYGVGLFGAFAGELYDLRLENVTITGNNFVGGFVGMMIGGKLENCHAADVSVSAQEYTESSDGIFVAPCIGKIFSGEALCCYHNLKRAGAIG